METITQRTTSVGQAGVHKPAGAAASVFEAGRMAKPRRVLLDPAAVAIKKDVPIPPSALGTRGVDRYRALLDRMAPGDCVELPWKQAEALVSKARKLGVKVTKRRISDDVLGVWRLTDEG